VRLVRIPVRLGPLAFPCANVVGFRLIMKQLSCSDSPLAMTPKRLRYKGRSRGTMQKIGGIHGSHGRLDGQPALDREGDYVENFPYNKASGGKGVQFNWRQA
jgi:hypothetical protein